MSESTCGKWLANTQSINMQLSSEDYQKLVFDLLRHNAIVLHSIRNLITEDIMSRDSTYTQEEADEDWRVYYDNAEKQIDAKIKNKYGDKFNPHDFLKEL